MILYEMITGEVIIETNDQEEGFKMINLFLKNKTKYIDKLLASLDDHLETFD